MKPTELLIPQKLKTIKHWAWKKLIKNVKEKSLIGIFSFAGADDRIWTCTRLLSYGPEPYVSAVSPHPLVAIQAHLMASPTNVGVPFIIAWLLLFACKFSLKIFGEVRLRSQNFFVCVHYQIKLFCKVRADTTCHPSCKMGRSCLLQAPSFVQDTPPRCIVHRTRSALYPFHHIRSFVATRTCLTLSIANARVRLSCVRLLLFICEFCFKILDEHACAWI